MQNDVKGNSFLTEPSLSSAKEELGDRNGLESTFFLDFSFDVRYSFWDPTNLNLRQEIIL